MFSDYKGIINLDEVLLKKYNFNYNGDISTLSTLSFIELEGDGKDALCWIVYNNERYLFKPLNDADYNMWGELVATEIANKLDIPCAEYRIATLGNLKGNLSKSFLLEDDILIIGSEIYQDFFNQIHYDKKKKIINKGQDIIKNYEIPTYLLDMDKTKFRKYTFYYLNNLEQTWSILENGQLINNNDIKDIITSLVKMLIFDLITLQCDRHPNNWGIIKSKDKYSLSPLYDNGTSLGLGYPFIENRINNFKAELMNAKMLKDDRRIQSIIYQTGLNFTLSEDNIVSLKNKKKDIAPIVLNDLLRKSDNNTRKLIISTLDKITPNFMDDVLDKVIKEAGINMNDNLYYYITKVFEINIKILKDIADKYRKDEFKNEVSRHIRTI